MGTPSELTLRARYVFPVESEPIANGWVRISHGVVSKVGNDNRAAIDLGNRAIVPGFVNAHTHLELTKLPGDESRDDAPPQDQLDWLRDMIAWRRENFDRPAQPIVEANLTAAIRHGTTTLADIATKGSSWEAMVSAAIRGVVYTEILGLKRARGLETTEAAFRWLSSVKQSIDEIDPRIRAGMSPHAPYSTSGWVYQKAISAGVPLSTHLAEFPAELELLQTHGGPLRDFLREIGAWDEGWHPLGSRPADYIRKGDLKKGDWLVAHGNYLDPSDFWQLRPQAALMGQRVAVAYCPRTHARFGHSRHPYREMLKQGAIVCIGTDSLATAPSLSVLDELRFLYRRGIESNGRLLLAMGTLFGAWALRLDHVCGSLAPGKAADFAVVELPDRDEEDPHRLLFDSDTPVTSTWFSGEPSAV